MSRDENSTGYLSESSDFSYPACLTKFAQISLLTLRPRGKHWTDPCSQKKVISILCSQNAFPLEKAVPGQILLPPVPSEH